MQKDCEREFFIGLNNIVSESMLIPLIYRRGDFSFGTKCTRKGEDATGSCRQNLQKKPEKERKEKTVL